MAGSAAHVTATVGLLKLTGRYGNNPATLFSTSSPGKPPPTPAHPGAGVGRALMSRHESRSLGCRSSFFHSSLFMITKEKNKIAPVGFTNSDLALWSHASPPCIHWSHPCLFQLLYHHAPPRRAFVSVVPTVRNNALPCPLLSYPAHASHLSSYAPSSGKLSLTSR